MTQTEGTVIYIEKENTTEAEFMSRSFVSNELKNRAYLNALGAELMIHYLKNEGIDAADTNNLHSISKILEEVDISDILLPNIHIDVRVIFDDSQIFIPQQQFSLGLTPDVYAVLKLSQDFTSAEFLGYFEPKSLNLKNKNSKYYFIEKEKLSSPDTFKSFIESFSGNTSRGLSQEDIFRGRELSVLMADHNISEQEKNEFFKLLLASSELRESVLEFDNFETLSYSVGSSSLLATEVQEDNSDLNPVIVDNELEDNADENNEQDENDSDLDLDSQNLEDEELLIEDDILSIDDEIADKNIEEVTSDDLQTPVNNDEIPSISIEQDDLAVESETSEDIAEPSVNNDIMEPSTLENIQPMDIGDGFEEDLLFDDNMDLEEIDTSVVETTITETLDITSDIGEELPAENILNEEPPKRDNSLEKGLGDAIAKALKKTAEAAAGAAAITAAGAVAGEAAAAAGTVGATAEAMKLAGISGELVSDLVNKNLESQQTNLDKIDYAKTKEHASTDDIPENVAAMDLSTAKLEANIEAEVSGKFDTPKDLSELQTVQTENLGYGDIEHETIDFSGMETVELDEIKEDIEDIVNLNNISSIDSPTKPAENQELQIQDDSEFLGMEMPNLSSYTINEDGSSPFDDMEIHLDDDKEEHLVDFNMNANEFNLDDNVQEESVAKEDIIDLPSAVEQSNDNLSFDDNEFDTAFEDDIFGDTSSSNLDFSDNTETKDTATQVEESVTEPVEEFVTEDLAQVQETVIDNNDEISAEELFSELGLDDNSSEFMQDDTEEISFNEQNVEPQASEENNIEDFEPVVEESGIVEDIVPNNDDIQIEEQLDNVVEQTEIQDNFEQEQEFIDEQEVVASPVVFNSVENSRVISDKNFAVGEIPIDINNIGEQIQAGPEQLEDLYDSSNNISGPTMLNNPGTLGKAAPQGKKGLGIIAVILTLIIVGVIGFAVSKMMKPAVDDTPQPITDEPVPMSPDNGISDANTLNVDQNNVVNMDNTVTQPVVPAPTAKPKASANAAKTVNNTSVKPGVTQVKKPIASTAFLEVKKLSWEVPDYVSYNQNFKQYFQSAGKSLKLSLTSDLLLATEPAYSNQIRVTVTFAKDGVFKDARILLSSGSAQIDNIVLQTVNQTLKVLKAPNSIGNDESTTVILKIYL